MNLDTTVIFTDNEDKNFSHKVDSLIKETMENIHAGPFSYVQIELKRHHLFPDDKMGMAIFERVGAKEWKAQVETIETKTVIKVKVA